MVWSKCAIKVDTFGPGPQIEVASKAGHFGRGPRRGALQINEPAKLLEDDIMKTWTKPEVREDNVGLEVTSYLPAEIDVI